MKASHWAIAVAMLHLAVPAGASAQTISQTEAEQLRAQIAALKAQVETLESRLDAAAPAGAASAAAPVAQALAAAAAKDEKPGTQISWKGGPQFSSDDARFKVKGRIQYDAGVLMAPDSVSDRAKGYSNELRRLRLGAEGQLGAGFGYKLETELSDNSIDLVDTFITYEHGKWLVTLGNHNQFQSLDELIGDTTGTVMERAAFTDAFNFERRLGLSAQYKSGVLLAQLGLFSDSADSLTNNEDGDENNSYSVDGRIVLAPKFGKTQLHFGASGHWRDLNRLTEDGVRYRQRPFIHTVNSRLLDTRSIAATGESHYGVEFAGTHGPLNWAGEAHWMRVKRPDLADPTFFGGYAEVGYFLTGETRSYKNGIFGSTKPKHEVGDGGMGSLQLTARYDYLDMNDRGIVGGTQNAWILGLIWTPIEYLRFNLNYANLRYTDAAIAAGTDRDYSVDVIGWRAELDF
ncbi:MAG TPA: porin [Sphingobium sp.]|nr:porin [Sphingobium sp.]